MNGVRFVSGWMTALLVSLAVPVRAGVVLTIETTNDTPNETIRTRHVLWAAADRFLVEMDGGKSVAIYRRDTDTFWALDPGRKTYFEMTRREVKTMRAPADQLVYRKIASGQKVGKWTATRYAVARGGRNIGEEFHADIASLGLTEDDLALLASMSRDVDPVQFVWPWPIEAGGPAGMRVRYVRFDPSGKPRSSSTIVNILRATLPVTAFEIPAGYARVKNPLLER